MITFTPKGAVIENNVIIHDDEYSIFVEKDSRGGNSIRNNIFLKGTQKHIDLAYATTFVKKVKFIYNLLFTKKYNIARNSGLMKVS